MYSMALKRSEKLKYNRLKKNYYNCSKLLSMRPDFFHGAAVFYLFNIAKYFFVAGGFFLVFYVFFSDKSKASLHKHVVGPSGIPNP